MMAGLVEKSVMNPMNLGMKRSYLHGISSRQISVSAKSARLLSLTRRCSTSRTGDTVGPVRRSLWTRAAAGSGQNARSSDRQQTSAASGASYLTDTPGFLNVRESNFFKPSQSSKGWDDPRLLAQLRSLAVIADDRSEMHSAVAIQRDNWGKLIQVTVIMSLITAGILSALNTRAMSTTSFSLSLTAALLSAVAIVFMSLENWFQPSQLAEEQRAAARFFKNLVKEIETSLKPGGSQLKEEATVFYEAKLLRVKYLDQAFPLPLFPGGTDKFPEEIGPSVLSAPVDTSKPELSPISEDFDNGWSSAIVQDLKRTSKLLKKSEIATYVGWEKNASKINKVLAIGGPLLALLSVVANFVGSGNGAVVATGCCVLAALFSSFSHDGQVGMVYEMYREVAGSFEDIDKDIQRNLRLPVDQREDGELFHQKIALQLGRMEGEAIVSSDDQESAGTLL